MIGNEKKMVYRIKRIEQEPKKGRQKSLSKDKIMG